MNRAIPSHRSAWQAAPCRHQIPCTCHRLPGSVWEGPISPRSSGCGRYSYTQWPTCQFQPSGLQQRQRPGHNGPWVARWNTLLPLAPWTFSIDHHNLRIKTYWTFLGTVSRTQVMQHVHNICFKGAFGCWKHCYHSWNWIYWTIMRDSLHLALIRSVLLSLSEDASLQGLLPLEPWTLSQKPSGFSSRKHPTTALSATNQAGSSAAAGFQVCTSISHHLQLGPAPFTAQFFDLLPTLFCSSFATCLSHHFFFCLFILDIAPNVSARLVTSQDTETLDAHCPIFGSAHKKCRWRKKYDCNTGQQ